MGLDLDPAALDRKVRTYSKGMGQKLGLVGAILANTQLMILDEPMSGPIHARVLLKDLLMKCRGEGRCIFFSSHILSDIDEICDRIGIIHGGRLIFSARRRNSSRVTRRQPLSRQFLAALIAPKMLLRRPSRRKSVKDGPCFSRAKA